MVAFHEQVKRYHEAGGNALFHSFNPDTYAKATAEQRARMVAEPGVWIPCCRIGQDRAGVQRKWLYLLRVGATPNADGTYQDGDTCCEFDVSNPCPPFCPPGGGG